jgi:N-acetyl sugar amidotransferase
VIYCSKCLMPSSRPRVVFTDGVCNACAWLPEYKKSPWDERRREFLDLVKRKKRHPAYDCVVAFSGGKDSASIAHRLKFDLGLNPLLVCYGQLLWTDAGRRNFHRVADAGFDIDYLRTNQAVSRKLARRFFIERGHPKQHYDSAINATVLQAAIRYGIPLVIYAEHGESFYGGHVLSEEHRRRRDLAEVLENQVGDDARNWAVDGITEADLYPYIMPESSSIDYYGVEAAYYSYYFPWDIYENARYCRKTMGFECAENGNAGYWPTWGKSNGSFEGFDSIDDKIDDLDYYMMHIKFGFGRATRMASRLIQSEHMTRHTGLSLATSWDGQFPHSYLSDVMDYLDMTRRDLLDVVDQHRNPEIWDRKDGQWVLKHPPQ